MTTARTVPAQPLDATMIASSRRQHVNTADKLARQIAACATEIRKQLQLGQPAGPLARQIDSDLFELIAELAKLAEDSRFAGWIRQPAA